jgi:hypothetical protein
MIKVSRSGSTRSPVIVIGPLAFKFARNEHGRASNLYEANLYRTTTPARRALLCPVIWVSPRGAVQIMRAAAPLTEIMSPDDYDGFIDAWDYMPGGEDGCPFEPKPSDWGWFKGRRVALDYSTPAWQTDGETMKCLVCEDIGWVCEAHPERPWEGPHGCGCGAAGAPCPWCNEPAEGETPRMAEGFKTVVDKDGWRH